MHIAQLSLTDFRSYTGVELALEPGVTVLVGPNGHGKTNLVEAVGYLATLGSHRVATDAPLVRAGAERAVVRGSVVREERTTLIEIEITPGRANRARLNRAPVPRPREVLGVLRTVLFAPEDLALVKGDPGERRRFLDDLLVVRSPRMAGVRQDYDRVLKQRNALLRSAGAAIRSGQAGRSTGSEASTLDVWDAHLAAAAAELLAARLDLVTALRPYVAQAYRAVAVPGPAGAARPSAGAVAALAYRSSLQEGGSTDATTTGTPTTAGTDGTAGTASAAADRAVLVEAMLAALARVRRAELERGISLVGPHRDDLVLSLGELPARGYASHGESWSLALALRLAAYDLLRTEVGGGGDPVLVLDDVFAELDAGRRDRLAALVGGAEQVLVTAAVPADVPPALRGARVDVRDGAVRRVA